MNGYVDRRNDLIKRLDEETERRFIADVREVMDTPAGQRLFVAIINKGGLFQFSKRDDNHAYVCGKHDAVLQLFKTIRAIAPHSATKAQIDWDDHETRKMKALDELNETP
jgi:hypothetical protein